MNTFILMIQMFGNGVDTPEAGDFINIHQIHQ